MDPVRAERVAELLEQALALDSGERSTFCEVVRNEDARVAAELESLLAAHEAVPEDLDSLAARILPGVLDRLSHALAGAAPEPQQTVGRYRIEERLGGGGMGEVYRARDLSLARPVALKFLPPHLSNNPEARARLMREARAASVLDHPNIAVVFEIGTTESERGGAAAGRLYIAMAYHAGETLRQKIARGPLPVAQAIDLAAQAADGLAAAHEAGIVHRDVKPANLIVGERGQLRILDFGVAKLAGTDLTHEGGMLGTIAYMSPEQTRGEAVDTRTDLWSLGVVLYEMLAGVRPFPAEDGALLLHGIRQDSPAPLRHHRPDVPEALERLVQRCLRKDPEDRFPDAVSLRDALKNIDAASAAPVPDQTKRRRHVLRLAPRLHGEGRQRMSGPALFALLVLALAAFALIVRRGSDAGGAAPAHATTIAVLPFTTTSPDPALDRLGRDLAASVASALDGIEDLRTVEPLVVLEQTNGGAPVSTTEQGLELAHALGAGRLLHGTLTRSGVSVRVDARLHAGGDSGMVAGVAVSGDAGDLAALTDSVAMALIRSLWRDRPAVSPILGAIRTRSVAALRAYLEGERFMARGEMPRAVDSFERAFDIDPTYWFAYWRSLYPRQRYPAGAADSARIRQVIEHRHEFPTQDRLLVESWMANRLTDRLRLLRDAVMRYDSYWPAWYAYGVELVHRGPYLGTTHEDARAALERTLELNPAFSSAWDRLGWVVTAQGDTAAMARTLRGYARATAGVEFGSVQERHARAYTELARAGLPPPDSLERVVDWLFSETESLVTFFAMLPVGGGLPRIQLGLNAAILAREPGSRVTSVVHAGDAFSWVSRGAWDSALVAIDRAASAWPEPRTVLDAYGLAVTGASLGLVPAGEAVRRRPSSASGRTGWSDGELSEVAWLDGILAHARGDAGGLARARAELEGSSAPYAAALRGSLAAFAFDLAGDRTRAARELARLEWDNADGFSPPPLSMRYRFLVPVNRLHAARWLREIGDDGEAGRLLTWSDGLGTSWPTTVNVTLGWIGFVDRAEIARAMSQTDRARRYYIRFLERHDMPVPALEPLLERARAGLEQTMREP
jgi:TolB-like protein